MAQSARGPKTSQSGAPAPATTGGWEQVQGPEVSKAPEARGAGNGDLGPKLSPATLVRLCYKDATGCQRWPVTSTNIRSHQIT